MKEYKAIFWDFDGVIKETVSVKADGFERLFLPYGKAVAARVREHHEANGGMSRYEKIPLYLDWAGQKVSPALVQKFCARFSELVYQAVIDAAWVPGIREYLTANHEEQPFFLITATPQDEIERILDAIGIHDCFREIHGAPLGKSQAIRDALLRWGYSPTQVLVVGDSEADFKAAVANGVPFLLRRTDFNHALQKQYSGPTFGDLSNG